MDAKTRTYHALRAAAERIGMNNYRSGLYKVKRNKKGQVVQGYSITAEHQAVIEAMPKVLSGEMSVDEAMGLLHQYDVMKQRLGA